MAEWIKSLQGLPAPIAILVVFAICLLGVLWLIIKWFIKPLTKSHELTAESIRKGLDANTKAVEKAVDHNEEIIKNHLSHNGDLWREVQGEMRVTNDGLKTITDSLRTMNNRHRKYDEDKGGKDPR